MKNSSATKLGKLAHMGEYCTGPAETYFKFDGAVTSRERLV